MERYSGNNAYRVKIKEREETRLVRRDNPRYEKFVKAKKKRIIGIMLVMMAFALTVILRYAQISVLNNRVQEMKKNLDDVKTARTNLEIERDRIIDLSNIEDIAVNTYGMATPKRDQIVYITVSRGDNIEVAKAGLFGGLFGGTAQSES